MLRGEHEVNSTVKASKGKQQHGAWGKNRGESAADPLGAAPARLDEQWM
jgi:hypothetical protein